MNTGNFYEILGVPANATPEEIQKAYHRLALTHHPDVRKAPDAEERMKDINAGSNTSINANLVKVPGRDNY